MCIAPLIVNREVAVSRAGCLHPQRVHDHLFSGVNAQLVLPALADVPPVFAQDLDLLRLLDVRSPIAGNTFAVKQPHPDSFTAPQTGVHGVVAAVINEAHGDLQALAVLVVIDPIQDVIQLLPDIRIVRTAHDLPVLDAPVLFPEPPADDLVFKPVILHVHAHGQHQDAVRQLCGVLLAPGQVLVLVGHAAAIFPQLPKARVVHNLKLPGIAPGFQVLHDDLIPAQPRGNK